MEYINCPYCKAGLEINHDDGFGYEEGVKHQMECGKCEKTFIFETSVLFYYEAEKADCLNGEKHEYKITSTYPTEFSRMECSICGRQRELTDDELVLFEIGTKKSYLKKLNKE